MTEREIMGNGYMALALKYGHIELKKGLSLHTVADMEAIGDKEIKSFFPEAAFVFRQGKIISECTDPGQIIDYLNADMAEIIQFPEYKTIPR